METIRELNDILENAKSFDESLCSEDFNERLFAIWCLIGGKCFVVTEENGKYKFYSSKFIGYKNNCRKNYEEAIGNSWVTIDEEDEACTNACNPSFDGRLSNKAISEVLGCACEKDDKMAKIFMDYCDKYGLEINDEKKFWKPIKI